MACQKVCKQGRDESKVTVFAKAHPYIFFTVQLDSAWESSKVHQLLYWQFMAVALYSSHFLLQHGLGMKLAVCLVGNYWVSYLPGSSQWYPWRHYVIQNCLVRILFVIVCKQCVYNPYSLWSFPMPSLSDPQDYVISDVIHCLVLYLRYAGPLYI